MNSISRRTLLAGAALTPLLAVNRPKGYLIDSTHLFSDDQQRFPYHRNATYRPPPKTVEHYSEFVRAAKLDHTVIIHSEVYQDDHRYLRYCFEHEPSPGYFKGTCLFDPIDPKTPRNIEELSRSLPGRIVGIRIHEFHKAGTPPTTTGPMRDRDMRSPGMKNTWRKIRDLKMMVEMQAIPLYAPQIAALASEFPDLAVQIDHFGLPDRGDKAQYEEMIKLSKFPRVYMRVETLPERGTQHPWYGGANEMARRVYDAFGPDRLIWEGYGGNLEAFQKRLASIDEMFAFASEPERVKIRGLNGMKLFGFPL